MAETLHTFTGGMDLDTEKALRSNTVTYEVNNFRLVTNKDGTNGALESVKGNASTLDLTPYFDRLRGHCLIRNTLVLFGTSGAITHTSQIYKINLTPTDTFVASPIEVYDDSKNNGCGELDFGSNIKTVGRYESTYVIKVYWCDGVNPVRFINVGIDNTTNGEAYNGVTNYYVGTDKLEFKPNFLVSNITSTVVKRGGSLEASVVQYAIQLYNKYGAETLFSPLTNLLHIVESSDTLSTSLKYEGSDINDECGKSVEISIRHLLENVGYDYMKVVRVQYTVYGGIPTVSLIADLELNKYFTTDYEDYKIVDTGLSLYDYTLEEIAISTNLSFVAKDITTKDDLLLVGNIDEEPFDIDFDARAFRFPVSNTTFHITSGGVGDVYTVTADTNAGWDAILDDVGEDNDCINTYNDLTLPSPIAYAYQWNSVIQGGSGRNIKYLFVQEEIELDSNTNNTKSGTNAAVRTMYSNLSTGGSNYSYENQASPYISQTFKGYQRGEIYRFGIVFFDEKGRSSKAKWVGDIRFPSFKESDFDKLAQFDTDHIESDLLGVKFYVRNVPAEAVAWQIVRMERTDTDRTVVSQGILSDTVVTSSTDRYAPYFPVAYTDGTTYVGTRTLDDDILIYMSPDINYGDLDYRSGDFFETLGYYSNYGTYVTDGTDVVQNTIKYSTFTLLSSTNRITPDKFKFVAPSVEDTIYSLGAVDFHSMVTHDNGELQSIVGGCAVFTYTGTFVPATIGAYAHCPTVVNLRRVNNSQYGGNTYENRFGNEYISCGTIVNSISSDFTTTSSYVGSGVSIYGGDTFIVMYERLHGIYSDIGKSCRVCYIPLESKYNLAINNGSTYNRNVGVDTEVYLIRENSGTHSDGSLIFEQEKDFYIYNTVYSNNSSVITYFSESNQDNVVTDYDTRVLVSGEKINNEIVDSWTKFGTNDFIDVDTAYGELSNLINFKNKIFFLQAHGFGILSINDRSIVTDNTSASGIILGTGGVLDRYDYISTYYGNTSSKGVIVSESGMYWMDIYKNELLQYTGESLAPISKTKKVDRFFKDNYNKITIVYGVYHPKYNEVWFSLYDGTTSCNVLVYNELFNCFTGFYTIPSTYFIQLNTKVWSRRSGATAFIADIIYVEDANDTRANFFGVQYDSFINIVHTEGYPSTKVYDNIEFATTSKNSSNINIFENTFNTIQVYNDYQNTGEVTLVKDTNLMRKERRWTYTIPRNIVDTDVSDNPDIFTDIYTTPSSILYKDRIRDNYSVFKFVYDNTAGDYSFYVPYVRIKFRISSR